MSMIRMTVSERLLERMKEADQDPKRIVAFGSSNTALTWGSNGMHNWVSWFGINIRETIGRHIAIVNQGINGDTTEHLIQRMERDVLSLSPKICMITIGANDAARRFEPQQYKNNMVHICERMREHHIIPVIQTYYYPLYESGPNGFKQLFEDFMELNREIGREMDIPIIDQYRYFERLYVQDQTVYSHIMRDWIHLNPIGQALMGEIASRAFGLPSLRIPNSMRETFDNMLLHMRVADD
jgi:lysophospholipase L1-like esterase